MKQTLFLPIVLLLLLYPCFGQKTSKPISDNDKAQIIKAVLTGSDTILRSPYVDGDKPIAYLAADNLAAALVPKIKGITIVLVTRPEIDKKVLSGFHYFAFGEFKNKGAKVSVVFSEISLNTKAKSYYANNYEYEFKKVKGRWRGQVIKLESPRS